MNAATIIRALIALAPVWAVAAGPDAPCETRHAQAQAWVDKGVALGDNSEAEAACYRKAIALDPANAAAHFNRGFVCQTRKELGQALEAYRACIEHDPSRADAYLNMAAILTAPGKDQDLEDARAALSRYLEVRKNAPDSAEVEAAILALENQIAALKQAQVTDHCSKQQVEQRLTRGFTRGASPYKGPRLPVQIHFAYDSVEILDKSRPQLAELAAALKGDLLEDVVILVEGHTDSRGPIAYNDDLGHRRAQSIRRCLVEEHGVPASSLRIETKGELQPIRPNDTPKNRAINRRVEFVNKAKLDELQEQLRTRTRGESSGLDQLYR